ncbi:MAG: hypothetical protein CL816_02055 [Coxiellaceae bacterium]|nr:hypothetical protein [Coxiellaceae bacterium]|tara:strand:+ start:8907 stop:9155 length:249 start_codon:yes stop_codon:yes gene_type:complete
MKSMKTLIISAAVCGAMALPLSGAAAPSGENLPGVAENPQVAILVIAKALHCSDKGKGGKRCKDLEAIAGDLNVPFSGGDDE